MNDTIKPTSQQLASITTEQVERVYSGKQGCMCGCNGRYYATQPTEHADVSPRMVTKVLNILKNDPRVMLQDGFILYIDLPQVHRGNRPGERAERNYVVYLKRPALDPT